MKTKIVISTVLATFFICTVLTTAAADIAPPLQPPGANPAPLEFEKTRVKMGFETVMITVEESSTLYYTDNDFSAVNASVMALFMMSNTGNTTETLQVLFPLNDTEGRGDRAYGYPEIQNLKISVNDQPVTWVEKTSSNPQDADDPDIKWAEFETVFPSEEVTFVEVRYDLQSTGYFPEATFHYVLETGAGWYGPIEEAHIHMFLPYEASEENVLFGEYTQTTLGGTFAGSEVIWDYENLEPVTEDNWAATIIAPHIWKEVLELRESIEQGDKSAYADITELYDELIMSKGVRSGTEALVIENYNAYHKALEFDPKDDDVLARFADFMLFLDRTGHGWDDTPIEIDDIYSMASQALEINQGNQIAPYVINSLEKLPYNYTPPSSGAAEESPVEIENQEAASESAPVVEEQPDIATQTADTQNNTIIYILAGGLAATFGAILVLVYKLGKKNAS